jgi:hypothetical protein
MKKTMTAAMAVKIYDILGNASLSKMDDTGKFTIINAMRALKPVATGLKDDISDARKQLAPEDYNEILEMRYRYPLLSVEERVEVSRVERELESKVTECMSDELNREHSFEFPTMDKVAFGALLASNDFNAATMIELQDALCEV